MPYEMSWYVEQRVISLRFSGNVTPEEIISTGPDVTSYLPDGVPPLFIIVDARDVTRYPAEISSIVQGVQNNGNYSTRFAHTVVVTDSRLINFLGTMTSVIFNVPIRAYKTIEEAEALLMKFDPELASAFASRHASMQHAA